MIENIYRIGQAVLEEGGGRRALLESLADNPPRAKKEGPYMVILKLDTESKSLDAELRELSQEGPNSVARYLWLGNPTSAAADQDRLTTGTLSYLVSQTIPNLLLPGKLDPNTELHYLLERALKKLYLDLGDAKEQGIKSGPSYRRNRRCWDLRFLGIEGSSVEELRERAREADGAKVVPQQVAKELREHFKDRIPSDGVLFTLELDGKLLVDDETYQEYLERSLIEGRFKDAEHGRCHLSNVEGPVTGQPRFKFKYYITDKQGFAAGAVQSGFRHNLAVSEDAYKAVLVGERFVRRRLDFYLAGTSGYLLPDLYTLETPQGFSGGLDHTLKAIKARADLDLGIQEKVDEEIADLTGEETGFALNLLFYKQIKSQFKVLRLIQDVPIYRLDELRYRANDISREIGGALFGESRQWDLMLKNIYYLLPVREKRTPEGGKEILSKPVLEFYATLITGGLVDRRELVDGFVELVNVHRFGNHAAYHISEPTDADYALIRYVAHSNLLLAFLRELDQLKEEDMQNDYLERLDLTDDQHDYLTRLEYGEEQTALYLLGTLIGEIGNAQYRLGHGGKGGDKTILNKINYGGMTVARVQRLATDLFDKLTQYRDNKRRPLLEGRNEIVFAQAQALITEHSKDWTLNATENVYYILSGYSHTTLQAMRSGKLTAQAAETTDTGGE